MKYTRKNDDVRPFEAGGDTNLEHFAQKTDSSLFALGNHSKKRPHNIVLGRFFDHRLHDVLELGVERYKGIKDFAKAATAVQIGNKVLHSCLCHDNLGAAFQALNIYNVPEQCCHTTIL